MAAKVVKPAEPEYLPLDALVGRVVELYWNGYRTGKVERAQRHRDGSGTLTVRFLDPHGTHRVELSSVRGIYWYKKLRKVDEFLALRSEDQEER